MNNIELIKGNLIEYGIKAVDDQSFNGSEKVYNDKYKSVTEELVKETVDFLSKALDEEQIIKSLYYGSKLPGLREKRKDMLAKGELEDLLIRADINAKIDFYSTLDKEIYELTRKQ